VSLRGRGTQCVLRLENDRVFFEARRRAKDTGALCPLIARIPFRLAADPSEW